MQMKTVVRKEIYANYSNAYELLNPKAHSTPQNPAELREMLTGATKIYGHKMPAVRIADANSGAVRDLESADPIGNNILSIFKFTPYAIGARDLRYFALRTVKVVAKSQMFAAIFSMNRQNEYILGYNHWSSNIFHFATEQLPSIMFVIQEIGSSYRNTNIPILCVNSPFLLPLLAFFEINNPVQLIDKPYIYLPQVDVVDVVYEQEYVECGAPSPEKIELVRSFILRKLAPQAHNIGILIRRRETKRSVKNHDDLLDLLRTERPDLEWRVFDAQPFDETVALFSMARLIVAPHGAGLTNMLFSPPGTKIVEIMPTKSPNLCYHHLAALLKFDHCIVSCDQLPDLSLVAPLAVIDLMTMESNEYGFKSI